MGFYETTYILHSALQEGRLHDIVSAIENKVKSLGAEVLYSDNWGRKKLAYLINKEKYGTYIFLQFKLQNSDKLTELSSEFEHNPNVLRYLNIKIDAEDVIVFHDDLDVDFLKIKAKFGGSSAGHNGIESIDKFIGKDYSRVRIGIGKPEKKIEVSDFVLTNFSEEEKIELQKVIKNIIDSIPVLIDKKLDLFSSTVNNK